MKTRGALLCVALVLSIHEPICYQTENSVVSAVGGSHFGDEEPRKRACFCSLYSSGPARQGDWQALRTWYAWAARPLLAALAIALVLPSSNLRTFPGQRNDLAVKALEQDGVVPIEAQD